MFTSSPSDEPIEPEGFPWALFSISSGKNSGAFSIERSKALATTSSTHCSSTESLSSLSVTKAQVSRYNEYKSHHKFSLYLLVIAMAVCFAKSVGICSGASIISALGERRRRRRFSQAIPATTNFTSISPFSF